MEPLTESEIQERHSEAQLNALRAELGEISGKLNDLGLYELASAIDAVLSAYEGNFDDTTPSDELTYRVVFHAARAAFATA